jgi:hypothetical protein
VYPGPFTNPQTVYKYSAIAKDLMTNIKAHAPHLKLSTAAAAVGAWQSPWWGGNLKGVWSETKRVRGFLQCYWAPRPHTFFLSPQLFPDLIDFMSKGDNAGGINVMVRRWNCLFFLS